MEEPRQPQLETGQVGEGTKKREGDGTVKAVWEGEGRGGGVTHFMLRHLQVVRLIFKAVGATGGSGAQEGCGPGHVSSGSLEHTEKREGWEQGSRWRPEDSWVIHSELLLSQQRSGGDGVSRSSAWLEALTAVHEPGEQPTPHNTERERENL